MNRPHAVLSAAAESREPPASRGALEPVPLDIFWEQQRGRIAVGLIALAALLMLWWGWGKWCDPIVDFGRELYVPWQLSEGKVLYRDIAHLNGPLSQYVNSLWFRLFGASLRTLALANAAVAGVLLILLYALLSRIGSRASAFLGCMTFVFAFGFCQITSMANYNFICPYSHELTHGIVLSLAAIFMVGRFADSCRRADAALAGLCVGLVFLTKPEVFLAAFVASSAGLVLALSANRPSRTRLLRAIGVYFGAMIVPALLSFALSLLAMPVRDAGLAAAGAVRFLFRSDVSSLPFYRNSMGIDHPGHQLWRMAIVLLIYGAVFVPPVVLGLLWRPPKSWEAKVTMIIFAAVATVLFWVRRFMPYGEIALPLPAILTAALGVIAVGWWRRKGSADRARLVLSGTLVLFSLLLLLKIVLNTRLYQYGFALAMPAALVAIVIVWDWLPAAIEQLGGRGIMLRAVTAAVLLFFAETQLHITAAVYARRTHRVGSGGDTMWCDESGPEVKRALFLISRHVPADATLVVLPEGAMLNYLSRRENPTPYVSLMPPEVMLFGEDAMMAAFQERPPDFILWTDEETVDYGFARFGRGYGERLAGWLNDSYPIVEFPPGNTSASPLRIALLKRGDPSLAGARGARD
ncbi:MAG: glycosyltransferase family 39 protein [Planctomycetia bacterium]|nr:glycosyltransferase family 39 protein [Planctomycetia bacterium]